MTCIVGVVGDDGKVYIGGDSAGVAGWSVTPRADQKVFRRGEWAFGFTSSFRMGQLIRYKLDLRPPPERDLHRYMATTFIDSLRAALREGGFATTKDGVETGGTFLVGVRGRLFVVGDDYQVGESQYPFAACGCGRDEARGALYVLNKISPRGLGAPIPPRKRVLLALEATAEQNGGVRGPFVVVSVPQRT